MAQPTDDKFFYHERALPMGIWVATQYGAALLAPLLSGYIYTGLGWRAPPVRTVHIK